METMVARFGYHCMYHSTCETLYHWPIMPYGNLRSNTGSAIYKASEVPSLPHRNLSQTDKLTRLLRFSAVHVFLFINEPGVGR